ncbi:MAG TPA: hypothetical protein VEQ85_12530, partial [Lacipirellulaceae bacterium]|nr:hypothetical protein [Lacipirellulaceae bacterium]
MPRLCHPRWSIRLTGIGWASLLLHAAAAGAQAPNSTLAITGEQDGACVECQNGGVEPALAEPAAAAA